ncbi:uncharacterized protein P884DRAFT_210941 [Thermothelomyces heterothallicus CBS 202.75]|uniref:uncharacterized protein n=1 Tax=Thermothelomyces heterothallicus CBS 202.75 TaxID=1149848 RepID=UPI00374431FA
MPQTKNDILPDSEIYDEYDEIKPGWQPVLDDILRTCNPESDDHIEYLIASLIKEYLLSNDDGAAAVFARRFDELYGTVYKPKFDGYRRSKKGWTGYLTIFYELLFRTAVQIQYDDPKQEKVIELLVELGKLPSRPAKIFESFEWVDSQVWSSYPLLQRELYQVDAGEMCLHCFGDLTNPDNLSSLKRASAEYVNYHAFRARCLAAGLDAGEEGRFQSEVHSISVGLDPGVLDYKAPEIDCQVMAAAQYIVLAGDVIYAECVKKHLPPYRFGWTGWKHSSGPSIWKHWSAKLIEIADALERGGDPGFKILEGSREALTDMVIKARDKMLDLEPELPAQSESRSAEEARLTEETTSAPEAAPTAQDSQVSAPSDSGTDPSHAETPATNSAPASSSLLNTCSALVRNFVRNIWK